MLLTTAEPAKFGIQCRDKAVAALEAGDWHTAYDWAKSWIMGGGGTWLIEPWLIYAASAVLHGQPRIATHSIDLALGHWISDPADRAILSWTRACVIRFHLRDPKTALLDLEVANKTAPEWLRSRLAIALDKCRHEATISRKRKPSVKPAPRQIKSAEFEAHPEGMREPVHVPWLAPGSIPTVWNAVVLRIPALES